MNQGNTWQRLAVGQAFRKYKIDLDQDIIADHCENGYGQ